MVGRVGAKRQGNNEALVVLLAERLGVPERQVVIVRGATSRLKVVEVVGLNLGDLRQRLA